MDVINAILGHTPLIIQYVESVHLERIHPLLEQQHVKLVYVVLNHHLIQHHVFYVNLVITLQMEVYVNHAHSVHIQQTQDHAVALYVDLEHK